ncbi:MAG: sulfotransferase [Oscillatoria sp. SIO1A7]|nr:sulfotransferase [Oscillatoria sp. SIO1A7]
MAIKEELKKAVPMPLKILKYKAWKLSERVKREWDTINARVNPRPIIVLGNQKSGTSAIAALLAEMTDLSVSIDLRKEVDNPTYHKVKRGDLSFAEFVRVNKLDFSRDIVKEPNLTLFYKELVEYFPGSQFVFVIRDPRDNIRSILNRLKIPGNLSSLSPEYRGEITPAWELIVDGGWLGLKGENYIEMLAERWNLMADVFLNHRQQMILSRYDVFVQDKVAAIERLAQSLNLPQVNDIAGKVDIQFQPRGNKNVNWGYFFGSENLAKIENICAQKMSKLDYPVDMDRG